MNGLLQIEIEYHCIGQLRFTGRLSSASPMNWCLLYRPTCPYFPLLLYCSHGRYNVLRPFLRQFSHFQIIRNFFTEFSSLSMQAHGSVLRSLLPLIFVFIHFVQCWQTLRMQAAGSYVLEPPPKSKKYEINVSIHEGEDESRSSASGMPTVSPRTRHLAATYGNIRNGVAVEFPP